MKLRKGVFSFLFASLVCCSLLGTTTDCHVNPPKQVEPPETMLEPKFEGKVYIDDKFSWIERRLVVAGLHEWERATNGAVRLEVQKYGSWNSDTEIWSAAPDIKTGETTCTKDIYIARVFSQDKIVIDIQNQIKDEAKLDLTLAGYCNLKCGIKWIIIVADRIDNADQYVAVTTHEMGHMLGLNHVKVENMTTMYPGLQYGTSCLTPLDTGQFCQVWKCDAKQMKPCEP